MAVPNKSVTLNLNGHKHSHVRANELLQDVFSNLVSNAIKHTRDRADIVIDLDVLNDNGSRCCRVMIEDNGPGIHDDLKGRIFNRMLKGTDKAKGMGLGLYLVKSLVDDYGGRVWVEDRVYGDHTKGVKFVVMLPDADN
jgi:signal transduction histidine kinase